MSSLRKKLITALLILWIIPQISFADAGIPMLIYAYPLMIFALIPVILLEAYWMKKILTQITYAKSLKVCSVSNIISTLLGVPIAWLLMLLLEFITTRGGNILPATFWNKLISVTLQSAWVLPPEGHWAIFLALMFLMIPFFLVSWFIEAKVSKKILRNNFDYKEVNEAVLWGNIYSYIFLELIIIVGWMFLKW